ncbi:hypothetical protein BT63DRAFT_423601 [Microthyrium microscopicum]|uniref:Septin-type G domain-containing protein n=1 Tax=Microthyrium microscopicum TaxID=703497 RepID=A0A6A6UKJ2_9PEZI|nr:hypothetical protein BT63DRAFT_423601 [Microthyrium microscopicum]
MRPAPGADASPPRPRKASLVDVTTQSPTIPVGEPTAFFLASGSELESKGEAQTEEDASAAAEPESAQDSQMLPKNSVFGVQSLSDALSDAFGPSSTPALDATKDDAISPTASEESKDEDAPESGASTDHPSPLPGRVRARSNAPSLSHPLTPLQTASPAVWSTAMPSTPKSLSLSLHLSDADDIDSRADDSSDVASRFGFAGGSHNSGVELIMPSLSLPDRRPFTERGKRMGRLRICVAGRKGVGKTSLLSALVKQCEDIVHIDPVAARTRTKGSNKVAHFLASTKAYPSWWSESMEESNVLRRRRSGTDDVVLERNLCFVDIPGSTKNDNDLDVEADPAAKYIEDNLWYTESTAGMTDVERLNLVSGRGGTLVDVVLFLFSEEKYLDDELDVFRHLASLTNVIPLIAKADQLTEAEQKQFKLRILGGLQHRTKPFLFGSSVHDAMDSLLDEPSSSTSDHEPSTPSVSNSMNQLPTKKAAIPPFAISSLTGSDALEMDASLLMASTYSPPLLSSELSDLVSTLFDPESMLWLRHSAASKYLSWRARQLAAARSAITSTDMTTIDPFRRTRSSGNRSGSLVNSSHRRRSEPVPRWPADFRDVSVLDGLPNDQRARWLLQRVNEEVGRGNIGVVDAPSDLLSASQRPALTSSSSEGREVFGPVVSRRRGDLPTWARKGRGKRSALQDIDPADPLGLIRVWDGWGRVVAWGVGGGVMVGAVWVVVVRGWVSQGGTWERWWF